MKTGTQLSEYVEPPCWEVTAPDLSEFLRHLPALAPGDSVLCLEGVDAPDIEAYLLERPAPYENATNQGFLRLRPKIFYMPITEEKLQGFATLSEKYAEPEVCSHLRVYRDERIILSWHDLPYDPFYVANEIEEDVLRKFSEVVGCEYVMNSEAV